MSDHRYDHAWFVDRAWKSLKKIGDGVWDYSDSLLLYTSSGSDAYEKIQDEDTAYFRLVTRPEREYLSSIAKLVADMLPNDFEYVDLGPGTEHKEQFFFDELQKQGKRFTYVPVDISDSFLNIARWHAEVQGIPTHPIKASFEELSQLLSDSPARRFISLGMTFSNYAPQDVLKMLRSNAGRRGFIFLNSQIRDRVDMSELQHMYQHEGAKVADDKLRLLGLDPMTDVSPRTADDGIRIWCTVLKNNEQCKAQGIETGDKFLVFQSLRYTKEQIQNELRDLNYTLFDNDSAFIASFIKT
jgi:hypothetical protein